MQSTEVPPGPKTVFVGGISSRATEATLKSLLEQQFGTIEAIRIVMDQTTGKSKGYGFVLFETEEDAERLIAEQFVTFLNRRMNVSHSFKSNGRRVQPSPSPLVMYNLTPPDSPPPSPVSISVGVPPPQPATPYCPCAACAQQPQSYEIPYEYPPGSTCADAPDYTYDVQPQSLQPHPYEHGNCTVNRYHNMSAAVAPSIPPPPPHLSQKHQHQPYVAYQPPPTPPITPPARQEAYPTLYSEAYGTQLYSHNVGTESDVYGNTSQYYVDSSAMYSSHTISEPHALSGSRHGSFSYGQQQQHQFPLGRQGGGYNAQANKPAQISAASPTNTMPAVYRCPPAAEANLSSGKRGK